MSFGFDTPNEPIRQALARAHAADILLFAAGHNDGANKALAFPASTANVIAVGATNSYGKDSNFTPLAEKKAYYFSAFGENVTTSQTEKSGTSFATPIAVGIAGVVMDYINHLKSPEAWPPFGKTQEQKDADLAERIEVLSRIKTLDGMTAILKMLSRGQDTYLAPWYLFKPGSREVRHMVVHKLRNLSDTD
ncbi:subtilisin-like protein [Amniculicola lignicola CBS 123094]|uniref:Subtilisin-like protein n=1 Tax=Amniculicola lignicola CBS 123094 TaxID=1392246 RepID=A0A6A5WYA6_9PLEO|nr:subtilisin-like protein [Amniculicola lignicola CBS 123094]